MGCVKSKTIPHSKLIPRSKTRTNVATNETISICSFTQTDRTVIITTTIPGIHDHRKRNLSLSATEFSFNFCVKNLKGKNWSVTIADLAHEIVPSKVSFIVKRDAVNLLLPKKQFVVWSSLRTGRNNNVPITNDDPVTKDAILNEETLLNVSWADVWKEMGNKFHGNGFYDEAIKNYSEAIKLSPNCALYYSNRAASLMMMKKYREALEDATKAIEIDKTYTKGYLRKGKIENILGMGQTAISTLKSGLEGHSNQKDLLDELNNAVILINYGTSGDIAFQDANFEEANKHYTNALMIARGSAQLLFKKLEVMIYCGEYTETLIILNGLPENSDWHYIMALLNYCKCNKQDAFFHINKTLGKDPKHAKGNDLKCKMKTIFEIWEESEMACQDGDLEKAQRKLEKLLKIDPNNRSLNADALCNIGLCFMKLGEYLKASVLFSRSIELRPTNIMYLNRAKCFDHLGRTQESVDDYERLYALNSTYENMKLLTKAKLKLMNVGDKDYYEIFGLQLDASPEAIRNAYQKLAAECQPDYFSSGAEKAQQERRYLEIHEAYYTLSDPMKRERYDRMTGILPNDVL